MGGALLLRPDGEVLCLPSGELEKLAPESDAGWRLTALVVGPISTRNFGRFYRSARRERQTVKRVKAAGESASRAPATVADPSVDTAWALGG